MNLLKCITNHWREIVYPSGKTISQVGRCLEIKGKIWKNYI